MQDRGLAAYIAELVGTLLPGLLHHQRRHASTSPTGASAQFGSDFAVVGLVHAFVLFGLIISLRRGQRRALQPGGDARGGRAIRRIDPIDAVVYILAQLSGGVLGALLVKGAAARRGPRHPLRRGDDQPAARRHLRGRRRRGHRHLPARARRSCAVATRTRELARSGRRCDRHHARLRGHGLRPADRRLVQPGPLVRPGAGRQRLRRRRLALPRRPDRRLAARGRRLPVRDRAGRPCRRPSRRSRSRPPRPRGRPAGKAAELRERRAAPPASPPGVRRRRSSAERRAALQ